MITSLRNGRGREGGKENAVARPVVVAVIIRATTSARAVEDAAVGAVEGAPEVVLLLLLLLGGKTGGAVVGSTNGLRMVGGLDAGAVPVVRDRARLSVETHPPIGGDMQIMFFFFPFSFFFAFQL